MDIAAHLTCTVRRSVGDLSFEDHPSIAGGQNLTTFTPILQSRFPCTNEISACNDCTSPLDSCPADGSVA